MKTGTKNAKIITDADIPGPMMIYNPMTLAQEKELGEWVAKRKALDKAKAAKKLLKKVS